MKTETVSEVVQSTQTDQMITQMLNAWNAQNKGITDYFNKFADVAYLEEIAPGRNRAAYILGHLISTSDQMLPMFDLGERLFPDLEEAFLNNPDKKAEQPINIAELKTQWESLNAELNFHLSE